MHALLLALIAQLPPAVEGLEPGETAAWLPPAPAGSDRWESGRLLDARSLAPVAGAALDATTEGYRTPLVLLGSARSGADGRFLLRTAHGGMFSEKTRVHAHGYRATTWPSSQLTYEDGDHRLYPTGAPLRLRVLDLDGRPVEGAEFDQHQSCSHDPSATLARSDEQGWIQVDDLTAFEEIGEFRLLAPGHAALVWLDAEDFVAADGHEPPALRVPRVQPVLVRALDRNGRPLARRRLSATGSPEYLEAWTDAEGLARFDTRFTHFGAPRELALYLADSATDRDEWLGGARFPTWAAAEPFPLRVDGDEPPPEEAAEAVVVLRATPAAPAVPVVLVHDEGWRAERPGEHPMPAGRVRLTVGAPFSGFVERTVEAELAPGGRAEFELAAEREPRLRVQLPAGHGGWLFVQAGPFGLSVQDAAPGELELAVPPDQPLTVLSWCCGETRRATHAPLAVGEDAALDLTTEECVEARSLRHDWEAGRTPAATVVVEVVDPAGSPVADPSLDLAPFARADEDRPGRFELPAGLDFQLGADAAGFLDGWLQGRAAEGGSETRVRMVLRRAARVEVVTARGVEEWGPYAPGPRRIETELEDGRRLRLRLHLDEGETRRIRVVEGGQD